MCGKDLQYLNYKLDTMPPFQLLSVVETIILIVADEVPRSLSVAETNSAGVCAPEIVRR